MGYCDSMIIICYSRFVELMFCKKKIKFLIWKLRRLCKLKAKHDICFTHILGYFIF